MGICYELDVPWGKDHVEGEVGADAFEGVEGVELGRGGSGD